MYGKDIREDALFGELLTKLGIGDWGNVSKEDTEILTLLTALYVRDIGHQRALVKMAYSLAAGYNGLGSGPKFPDFWLNQMLPEGYDPGMLTLYEPIPTIPQVTQECSICHESFQVEGDLRSRSVTISTRPVCPKCQD